jgi:hypothetical protein
MARERIRIGCGAGFADDRIPPGVEIVERGELDYLAMECLAERTIARETLDRAKDPAKGYTPVLLERMEAIMPPALERGIKIVTNMGAANPMGAARAVRKDAAEWNCSDYTCAVVTGDEVTDVMRAHPELPLMEDGAPLESLLPRYGLGQRVPRCRRGSARIRDWCRRRHHRTRGGSGAVPRTDAACIRLVV